jgi:hypothetical protein
MLLDLSSRLCHSLFLQGRVHHQRRLLETIVMEV